jgi:hypothetical protein
MVDMAQTKYLLTGQKPGSFLGFPGFCIFHRPPECDYLQPPPIAQVDLTLFFDVVNW